MKRLYFGVKMFHLFLKSIKCYFPTRVLLCGSFVVILILRKVSFFINHVHRLHTHELFEIDVFMTKISFRLFYCCDAIFWIWNFQTIPLKFFFSKVRAISIRRLATCCYQSALWTRLSRFFPLDETFMEGGTDDPVYLPSVRFLKHLVLALLETKE